MLVAYIYCVVSMVISKNEHVKVSLCRKGIEVGLITANQTETMFYLYEPTDTGYRKLGKAENPLDLEQKYKMYERMHAK